MEYLFVYGTLQTGFTNQYQKLLSDQAEFVGEIKIKGKLYDLGEYPGAVKSLSEDSVICGEVYKLPEKNKILFSELDEYEGDEYKRELERFKHKNDFIDVWVYWYIMTLDNTICIEDGSYKNYLKLW